MAKSMKIALPILLLVAIVITALSVFLMTANAAGNDEATIKAYTVTYGTDTKFGYEGYPVEKSTTLISGSTANGSFADLADTISSVAPAEKTRYILTINKDITVSAPIVIEGNENTEVWIDFQGHTVTSTVNGPMITVTGTGATVRIFGEFNADGSYGKFVTAQATGAFVKIAEGSTDYVDVNYVDCVFTSSEDNTAMFIAEGGKLTFEHSSITHTSGKNANMFDVKNGAKLNLKYSHFEGGKSASLVNSSAADVYIEGGYFIGYAIVQSDASASDIVVTGLDCEVDTAFVQGSADTKTYVLGSTMEIYTAVASGLATKDNLVFYYGDGSMTVIGQDFAQYGIANSDVFTVTEAGGVWSMSYTGTNKFITTSAMVGQAPAVAFATDINSALKADLLGIAGNSSSTSRIDMKDVTASTVRITTMLANASGSAAVSFYGCEDASVIVDFNGYDFSNTSTSGSNMFQAINQMHIRIDGEGAGGRSKITGAGKTQRLVYAAQASASGQISKHLVSQFSNFDFVATNLSSDSASSSAPIDCCAGYVFLENVSLTYSGTSSSATADKLGASGNSNKASLMYFTHDTFREGVVFMNNVKLADTATNGMIVTGISAAYNWRIFADQLNVNGVDVVIATRSSTTTYTVTNSSINTPDVVFSGSGKVNVTDTVISTATGNLCSGGIAPHFYYGTGKTSITIGGSSLNGSTTAEEGYGIGQVGAGTYKLVSISGAHSITMPAVFSSGMMLQRGKVVNVYGYCDSIGATISVTIGDVTSEAIVGEDGKWSASFEPLEAARGVSIIIDQIGAGVEGTPDVQFNNVNIGEIWVMSGQSNASLFSGYLEDVNELALLSETLGIREFTSNGYTLLPDSKGNGTWKNVTSSVVKEKATYAMSAAGYATVAKLAAELGPDVPVGLITLAQGSTKISTWLDYEHVAELSPWLANRYDQYKISGALPSSAHGSNAVPTVLYNRHVAPLEGFTTAGVMWYQGCGDIPGKYYKEAEAGQANVHYLGPEGRTYSEFFAALQEVFRGAFDNGGDDLPFYVMQLAPYSRSGDGPADGSYIYEFRLEQYDFCNALPNTYLVSLATEGMAFTKNDVDGGAFIHPSRKSPVGNRTADMILANEYGIQYAEVVAHPMPISAVRNADGTVTITFDTDLKLLYGDTVEGFELKSGSTWKKATGTIDGNKLILSGVDGATEVRYGFGRTQVELRDGTVIEVAHNGTSAVLNEAKTQYTLTDAITGNKYTVDVGSLDAIRTKNHGNLTNASGIPLVLFSMDVTAE